jgi:hypothetical protein
MTTAQNISSNARPLYTPFTGKGEPIPCIGTELRIRSSQNFISRERVLEAADKFDIPKDKFRPILDGNAFIGAVRMAAEKRRKGEEKPLLTIVENTPQVISFQFDKKVLAERISKLKDENGDESDLSNVKTEFVTECTIVYSKESNRLLSDDPNVLDIVQSFIGICKENYKKANFQRYIREILEEVAGIVKWDTATHFVPAKHIDFMNRIIDFVKYIDPAATIRVVELPDLSGAKDQLAKSVDSFVSEEMKDAKAKIVKLFETNEVMSDRVRINLMDDIESTLRRVDEYAILAERDFRQSKELCEEVKKTIKVYRATGKLENPFKKLAEAERAKLPPEVADQLDAYANGDF